MLNPGDVFDVLAKSTGYASHQTPVASEVTVLAWVEHFDQFPHIDREDALAAVTRYYRDPHDRMLTPADISKIARDLHQDRALRTSITTGTAPARSEHRIECMAEIRRLLDTGKFGSMPL